MMDSIDSKKKYWECKHGCKASKVPCKHLERLLSDPNKGRLSMKFMEENIQAVVSRLKPTNAPDNELEEFLYNYGLDEWEVELLLDRFVARFSYDQIATKQGYTSSPQVRRLIQITLNKLKASKQFKQFLLKKVNNE